MCRLAAVRTVGTRTLLEAGSTVTAKDMYPKEGVGVVLIATILVSERNVLHD